MPILSRQLHIGSTPLDEASCISSTSHSPRWSPMTHKTDTHKACHQAGVAHVTLKCNALSHSSRHNGGSSSTECPVEKEHVPAAVITSGIAGAAQSKVTTANEGVGTAITVGAKSKPIAAERRTQQQSMIFCSWLLQSHGHAYRSWLVAVETQAFGMAGRCRSGAASWHVNQHCACHSP